MKLKLEFANGEDRIIEKPDATDFNIAVGKIFLLKIIETAKGEMFQTAMIVKVEEVK